MGGRFFAPLFCMTFFSIHLILANGLQFGFDHSSRAGLAICAVLVVLSVFSWSVMVAKLWLLSRAKRANREFLQSFRGSNHPLAIFQLRERHDRSPLHHIYHAGSRELAFYLLGSDQPDGAFATRMQGASRITSAQMNSVQNAMERAVAEAALRLEARMSVVSMALSGAPFLGLLGTAWGVMDSFAAISESGGNAGLQAMAPGVCAALLTTVAGLLVAVPSLFGYNFLVSKIRAHIARLDHFASELSGIFDRHFVDHYAADEPLPSIGSLGTPSMPSFSNSAPEPMPAASAMRAMSVATIPATSEL